MAWQRRANHRFPYVDFMFMLCFAGGAGTVGLWNRCVFVANDHGQVLEEWLTGAAEHRQVRPVTVLHVDAHNDLNVPELDVIEPGWADNATRRFVIADSADLANFQQIAAWAGLVDRVVWIRQGWGEKRHFHMTLLQNLTSGKFSEGVPQELESATDGLDSFAAALAVDGDAGVRTRGLRVDEVPEEDLFEVCVSDTCSGMENLIAALRSQPYILDMDLDFFVSDSALPSRPPWATHGSDCHRPCRRWSQPECEIWPELEDYMREAEFYAFPSGCAAKVTGAWATLPAEQKERMAALHTSEQLIAASQLQRQGPCPLVEATQLKKRIAKLESLLAALKDQPPVGVTIARSVDAFTRIFDAAMLEEAVLRLVQRVWDNAGSNASSSSNLCVRYAPGTSPLEALPRPADFVSADSKCADA
eukprot:CAMPEP_0117545258 /NCGR_PEP_ID=MMETSP0784-20121206/46001_1 /TAXON_ID=39447 /ORGANISM="" /LENGTH=417 /DNA_ID=CAMNT_0005342097 /DNA_START=56 /DNA_END=1310 /DNA_ORIENTATION=+